MKTLRIILLSLFTAIVLVTIIILAVYLATFNKGISNEVSFWNLFMTFYNATIATSLAIANIWVFYKLTLAIEDKNENRHIKSKLYDTQKLLTDLRVQEYVNLKSEINSLFANAFSKKEIKQNEEKISSILMRMENSILFGHSNSIATSVLTAPIRQIMGNINNNMTEDNYNKINQAMTSVEMIIFLPLFEEEKTLEYIRKNKAGVDPTILGICSYLEDKLGYSK